MVKRRLARSLVTFAVIAAIIGCTRISILSGPRTLSAGDSATYVLSLGGTGGTDVMLHVVADVPASWSLLSSWYDVTIGGVPVSGPGTVVTDCYFDILPSVADGFQRICIRDGPFDTDPSDTGELTLEFAVTDVPDGEFVLRFWFAATGFDGTAFLGPPAYAEINREPHVYRFASALNQASGALESNYAVASSSDGRSVVLGGGPEVDISVMDRDPLTGSLSHNQLLNDASLKDVRDLAIAPGDQHVYGVDDRHLACFQRDPITGQLSVSKILEDDVGGVDGLGGAHRIAISPDGASVYVSAWDDQAVSVFDRDPSSGGLSFVEAHFDGLGGLDGMVHPAELKVSPDGANIYVAGNGDHSMVVFDRDPTTGSLTYNSTNYTWGGPWEIFSPWSLAVSPDGNYVYAAAGPNYEYPYQPLRGRVGLYSRDPESGHLSFVEAVTEGDGNVVGFIDATDLALSPDGRHLFFSGSGSLVVFSRDPASGGLTFLNADFNHEGGVTGIPTPFQIAISADGSDLFYGSFESMAVFSTRSFADGFETGDTSTWTAVVP